MQIESIERGVHSDGWGQFRLEELPLGSYEAKISYLGYASKTIEIQLGEARSTPLWISLEPNPLSVKEVLIHANSGEIEMLPAIAALDLQNRPLASSQDALRAVPGLFTGQHAGGGKAEQLFLRGFDIDHGTDVAISVDGMPVNMVSHAHGQGYADLHFVIPETIGAVDYGKGPYSAKQGNFATAGHVALETLDALPDSKVKLEVGQFGTKRLLTLLDVAPEQTRQKGYIAAEYLQSEGYFEAAQQFERLNVLGKYHAWLGDKTRLEASVSAFSSQWDASGQIPLRAVQQGLISRFGAIDSTEGGATSRNNISLELTHGLSDQTTISQQIFVSQYTFDLFSNFTFFLEDSINGDQIRQREHRILMGYKGRLHHHAHLGKWTFNSEIGWGLRLDRIPESILAQTLNRYTTLASLAQGRIRETNGAIYMQQLLSRGLWQAELGLRYDQIQFGYEDYRTESYDPRQLNQGIWSPKAQLRFHPHRSLRLYVQAGQGFHANDTRTIMSEQGRKLLPRAFGTDLGLWWKPSPSILVQGAIWRLGLEQEFVYVGDAGIVEPGPETQRWGTDLSVRWQILPGMFFDGDWTYSQARAVEVPETEMFIPLAPTHTIASGLRWEPQAGYWASLRYRHLADRPATPDGSLIAEGYHLFDLVLQGKWGPFSLQASMENLFNVDWKEAQFETTSRLQQEALPVTEIHFTPGAPFFARLSLAYQW